MAVRLRARINVTKCLNARGTLPRFTTLIGEARLITQTRSIFYHKKQKMRKLKKEKMLLKLDEEKPIVKGIMEKRRAAARQWVRKWQEKNDKTKGGRDKCLPTIKKTT